MALATRRKYYRSITDYSTKQELNVIKVSNKTFTAHLVTRALSLFEGIKVGEQTQKFDTITLIATDKAITKEATVADVVRRRIPGIHQINIIGSVDIQEVYIPLEEGLVEVTNTKKLACLTIKLTTNPTEEDKKAVGYIEPLPADQVVPNRGEDDRNNRNRYQNRNREQNNRDYDNKRKGSRGDRDYDDRDYKRENKRNYNDKNYNRNYNRSGQQRTRGGKR